MDGPLLYLETTNATSERDWPHYLALLDHCTHVVDLGHDLQDHVQLRILKKSANRNELYKSNERQLWSLSCTIKVIFWVGFTTLKYTTNVCRDLQGLCGGFLQSLQGKSVNITLFSLKILHKTPADFDCMTRSTVQKSI
jgi:hypothetical protein